MSDISLTVIGSGDAFGSGGRFNTCFHVKSALHSFLIDCGASSLVALKQNKILPDDIDTIFITHFHGDHYGGVPFLLLEMAVYQRSKPVQVLSPPGGKDKIQALLELLYPGTIVLEKLNILFTEYEANVPFQVKNMKVVAYKVPHSEAAQSHALRFELDHKTIAYSGDTEWTDALIPLSQNADIFICECNFFQLQIKNHLNYRTLSEKRDSFSCKRMLLTHFDTEMLENQDKIGIDMTCDGMKIDL